MKLFKLVSALLASFALAVAIAVATPAPAEARIEDCPSGAMCLWGDTSAATNGNGRAYRDFQRYIPDLAKSYYRHTRRSAGDSATSFYNNGQAREPYCKVMLYKGANGTGERWLVDRDSYYWNLALQTFTWNDTISSAYFYHWSRYKTD